MSIFFQFNLTINYGHRWNNSMSISILQGTGTFRAHFRSQERIVTMWNFHSRALSFSGTFVPGERKFPGTFVPWTFHSQELSFLRLFNEALAINADSYSNCQNLFRRRPSSVCFPKINWVSLLCVRVVFFLLNKNAKWINVMIPVDKLTLILGLPQATCAPCHSYRHIKDRETRGESRSTYVQR